MAKLIRVWDGTTWQSVGNALPNALTIDGTQILTNKTINLASNTVSATLAQLNTAVSDADVASLAGSETLTNKTINLASNTVNATLAQLNSAVSDADVASLAGTETLTNKTISGSSNTLSNINLASQVTGTLPVGNGGTGQTTATAATNALLPSQTSNSGKYLTTDGTNTSWGTVDLSGKTDKSILTTTGDIYYASSANTPARIGIGSSGQVLTVASGIPSWATASGGGSLTLHSTTAMSGNTVSISLPASSAGYKKLILLIVGWTMTGGNGYHTTRFNGVSSTIYFATARSACGHGQDGDSSQINSTGFNFPWPHNMNNGSVGNAHFEMLNPYESSTKLFSWTLSGNEGVGGAPKCAVRGDGAMFYDDVLTSLVMSNDSGGKSYNSGTAYLYGVK